MARCLGDAVELTQRIREAARHGENGAGLVVEDHGGALHGRAHPQLGARGRKRLELTEASAHEQRRAGLDACTDEEFAQLLLLNTAYVEKFAFPFILAVRGHDPDSILAAMSDRLNNDVEAERNTALAQIGLIGGYRLADLVGSPAGAEVKAMRDRLVSSATTADTVPTTAAPSASAPSATHVASHFFDTVTTNPPCGRANERSLTPFGRRKRLGKVEWSFHFVNNGLTERRGGRAYVESRNVDPGSRAFFAGDLHPRRSEPFPDVCRDC